MFGLFSCGKIKRWIQVPKMPISILLFLAYKELALGYVKRVIQIGTVPPTQK